MLARSGLLLRHGERDAREVYFYIVEFRELIMAADETKAIKRRVFDVVAKIP